MCTLAFVKYIYGSDIVLDYSEQVGGRFTLSPRVEKIVRRYIKDIQIVQATGTLCVKGVHKNDLSYLLSDLASEYGLLKQKFIESKKTKHKSIITQYMGQLKQFINSSAGISHTTHMTDTTVYLTVLNNMNTVPTYDLLKQRVANLLGAAPLLDKELFVMLSETIGIQKEDAHRYHSELLSSISTA